MAVALSRAPFGRGERRRGPTPQPTSSARRVVRVKSSQSCTRVDFASIATIRVGVTFNLYASVFALACDGICAVRGTAARSPAAVMVDSLPVASKRALLPIVARGHSLSPDCLTPGIPTRDSPLAEELDRLRSLSRDDVRSDLERTFADTGVPAHWLPVWRNPRRWVEEVTFAFDHIGTYLEGTWRRSTGQREREAQRIGTAVARGGIDVALAAAHPRGRLRGMSLQFRTPIRSS